MRQTRGDTVKYHFQRIDKDGNPITIMPDKIYFTVKKCFSDKNVIFQKTIDDMQIDVEEGLYHFTVEPEDTNDLKYGTYVYDIEVITDAVKTTISKGEFILEPEVTFAENEV